MRAVGRVVEIAFVVIVLSAVAVFSWGFVLGWAGDAGKPVGTEPMEAESLVVDESSERIVMIGDSLARGAGDPTGDGIGGNLSRLIEENGREVEWTINLGVNGARTIDVLERLEPEGNRRSVAAASVVVLSVGANDVFFESGRGGTLTDIDPSEILERVDRVLTEIRTINPDAVIFVVGLYNPFPGARDKAKIDEAVSFWNGELVRITSNDPRALVVQTSDLFVLHDRLSVDRFHPGSEAYGMIAARIAQSFLVGP